MQTKHTPTPWIYRNHRDDQDTMLIDGADGYEIATCYAPDAPFIVRACNAHDELVAALDWALSQIGDDLDLDHQRAFDGAIAALAKARGES